MIKKLNLKIVDEIKWPKLPEELPPKHGTPFFSNMVLGTRGQGKTHAVLELMQNFLRTGFYNCWFCVSPTRKGDPKQKVFFQELEQRGFNVYYFEDFNEKVINEIKKIIMENIEIWNAYTKIKKILDKYRKGIEHLNNEELYELEKYLDDDGKMQFNPLNDFPEFIKRNIPPCSYLFIDDCYGSKIITKTTGYNPFTWIVIRHRHLYLSFSLLVQGLQNISRAIRNNCILWLIFPTKSKNDLKILYEENANIFENEEEFYEIMAELNKKEHSFLYIDSSSTMKPDLRIGFNSPIEPF